MLVHGVVVVVAPEVVITHLVPLMLLGRSPCAHPDVVTPAPCPPPPGEASGVRVTREAALTGAARTLVLCDALRPEAALEFTARDAGADEAEGWVIHPSTQVTVSILPDSID